MPFNISFTRTFKHKPWVDKVDRVDAGGENGFNIRFKALEFDLDVLHDRFNDISTALNVVAAGGGPDRTITVPPLFISLGPTSGAASWDLGDYRGGARGDAHKTGSALVTGVVPVQLPQVGTLTSLTVTGTSNGSSKLQVALSRFGMTGLNAMLAVAEIPEQHGGVPYSVTTPVAAGFGAIDPACSYAIIASAEAGSDPTDYVDITSLQIAYQGH
ncbi:MULTISPECIES: hypothetical protein [unclassified Nocardia]|uniref:hypothetical protein n=1 Tax=unclassified Nocardia TaxID=2637762 RepID=UPI001CE4113E|nr:MULTISPECIES: hypothetical protein [unclassified Nocardia]